MLTLTKIEKVTLFEDKPNVTLTSYIAGTSGEMPFNDKRKAILVIPGGGYGFCSDREGEPIAHYYMAHGFNAFVLRYSVHTKETDATWPAPLIDASAAMKYIRDHAEEFHIDPDYVFVVGFSAGGHLAASSIVRQEVYGAANDAIDQMPHVPNGAILCYPVISVDADFGHVGSGNYLLGEDASAEERAEQCHTPCTTFTCGLHHGDG